MGDNHRFYQKKYVTSTFFGCLHLPELGSVLFLVFGDREGMLISPLFNIVKVNSERSYFPFQPELLGWDDDEEEFDDDDLDLIDDDEDDDDLLEEDEDEDDFDEDYEDLEDDYDDDFDDLGLDLDEEEDF